MALDNGSPREGDQHLTVEQMALLNFHAPEVPFPGPLAQWLVPPQPSADSSFSTPLVNLDEASSGGTDTQDMATPSPLLPQDCSRGSRSGPGTTAMAWIVLGRGSRDTSLCPVTKFLQMEIISYIRTEKSPHIPLMLLC